MSNPAAGAMPGTGATPDHRYPFGQVWAPYRLPFPGSRGLIAREVGVAFEGEPGDGDAPPPAPPAPPADPPKPPATGDDDALGEGGKRALQDEREKRKTAERLASERQARIEELEGAGASEHEKAIKAAKADAEKSVKADFEAKIRRSEARSALRAAGVTNEKDLELAANAPDFASLSVDDSGAVPDLAAALETFRKDHPSLFAPPAPKPRPGDVSRGPRTDPPPDRPKTLGEAIAAQLSPN